MLSPWEWGSTRFLRFGGRSHLEALLVYLRLCSGLPPPFADPSPPVDLLQNHPARAPGELHLACSNEIHEIEAGHVVRANDINAP